jgi:DNA-binding LytR/AlgR family response regulator
MHVVHIEGDELLRQVLKRAVRLSNQHIRLQQFAKGDEATPYIEHRLQDVDLFFISIELPGRMNGVQFARNLRSRDYRGTIVLTSAHDAPDGEWLVSHHIEYLPQPGHIRHFVMRLPSYQRRLEASTPWG